jgi:hypothetical protein
MCCKDKNILKFCLNVENIGNCYFRESKPESLLIGYKINGKLHCLMRPNQII